MRKILIGLVAVMLGAGAVGAQEITVGFEQTVTAEASPAGWQMTGNLLPVGWNFNSQYGGTVEVVEGARSGNLALRTEAGEQQAHMSYGAGMEVALGDMVEFGIWVREGAVQLVFYELADQRWVRSTSPVMTVTGSGEWAFGGGFHVVTDPEVNRVVPVLVTAANSHAVVDDMAVRRLPAADTAALPVVFDTDNARITLSARGTLEEWFDKTLNEDLCFAPGRPFMNVTSGQWRLPITGLVREGDHLTARFGDDAVRIVWAVDEGHRYVAFRAVTLEGDPVERADVARFSLHRLEKAATTAVCNYDDRTATGLLSLNYSGQSLLHTWQQGVAEFVCTYGEFALNDMGFAIVSAPREEYLHAVENMARVCGLPAPRIDGVWNKLSPAMQRSYFFVTDLTADNVDEVISWGKRGNFDYILILGSSWAATNGTYAVNERNFPGGIEQFKQVVSRMQNAGFKVGLHFLAAGIDINDPLIHPVPNDNIVVDGEVVLAEDIDDKADFIPVTSPPEGFPDATDEGYIGRGRTLRIGDELIVYGDVQLTPPYGFTNCVRGAYRTNAAAHSASSPVRFLVQSYNLFLIDADSELMDQVAQNVADVFNYCNLDGLYFDGSERLQGPHWYYNPRIQSAYYEKVNRKDIIMQGSSVSHYSWHLLGRHASADGFRDIKGYLDKRTPSFISWYANNFMPLDIGWYAINPNIRPDDIEYICSRALGFNASVSIQTGIRHLTTVPQAGEMIDLVARWEDIRLNERVPERMRQRLTEIGSEYRLKTYRGRDTLAPTEQSQWGVMPQSGETETVVRMAISNPEDARVEIQLECGIPVRPPAGYDEALVLESFEDVIEGESQALATHLYDPAVHGQMATSAGVTQNLSLVTDDFKDGSRALRFEATSTRGDRAGWATFGKKWDPAIDFGEYKAVGLWIHGDGKGQMVKVQFRDTHGGGQDHYATIDFTG